MQQRRFDGLSDGIFAIVMTLLVLEIQVPEFGGFISNGDLIREVVALYPSFLSYLLSFALLFTYWRSHTYIMSIFAQNMDMRLANYNLIFFMFVGLVPFSSHLLAQYSTTQFGMLVIGLNTALIGLALYAMRNYVIRSDRIQNSEITPLSIRHGTIRILVPVVCALAAMVVSFYNVQTALIFFTLGLMFNFIPQSASIVESLLYRTSVSNKAKARKK